MAAPTWQVLQTSMADMQNHSGTAASQISDQGQGHVRPSYGPPALNFSESSPVPYRDYSDLSINTIGPSQQSLHPGSSLAAAQSHMMPPSNSSLGAGQPLSSPGKQILPQGQVLKPSVPAIPPGQLSLVAVQPPSGYSGGTLQQNIYPRPGQSSNPYPPPPGSFFGNRWSQQSGASASIQGGRPPGDTAIPGSGSGPPHPVPPNAALPQVPGAASGPSSQNQALFQNFIPSVTVGSPQIPPWLMTKQQSGQPQSYPSYVPYSGYQLAFSRPIRPPAPYQEATATFPLVQGKQPATSMPTVPPVWGSSSSSGIGQYQPVSKDIAPIPSDASGLSGLPAQFSPRSPVLTPDERSQAISDFGSNGDETADVENLEEDWTAHRTADGRLYYYDSVSGKSTYERPSGFKGEADKVTAQPTPVSWERLAGTDWTLVTTNDSKKYYYNTKTQATSWQVPQEVAQLRREQVEEASRQGTEAAATIVTTPEKSATVSFSLSVPAAATGGRDAKGPVATIGSSALDLIKKKLQDVGSPMVTSAAANSNGSSGGDGMNGKSVPVEIGKEKPTSSDSSSESDDDDLAPTKEERVSQFKEMLKEKGVAPFSKWEKELPKIIFDERFKAIPSYTERRSIFEHYVKNRADEERKEKRAAQKAAIEGFKQLLDEAEKDMNHATDYGSFTKLWSSDPRFQALDRKDREALLQERVLPLRKAEEERVKAELAAAVDGFKAVLRERGDINTGTRWSKVKDSMRHDPRFRAVKREDREGLFNSYLADLRAAEQEAERSAKAKRDEEEKLKEREREMRKRKEREEQEVERVRAKARRKEAISAFQTLLNEKIKDPEASWTEARLKLGKDPQGRASNPELDFGERERLFREHVNDLYACAVREYRLLLADILTVDAASKHLDAGRNILASWSEAKKLLKADPRYARTPHRERETWWRRYSEDVQRRLRVVKPESGAATNGSGVRSPLSLRRNPRI